MIGGGCFEKLLEVICRLLRLAFEITLGYVMRSLSELLVSLPSSP
jgi:hypothetical protein